MLVLLRQHPAIAVTTAVIIALLVWGFWPRPVMIEAVEAVRAPLAVTIEEEGRTRVIDRYVVSAPVDGIACRVTLEVGDPVLQGQVLLGITPLESQVLDPRSRAQARARVSAAEAALQAATEQAFAAAAAERFAANEVARVQPLAAQGLISREALDRAETGAKTSVAAKRSADFSVEVARYELEAARTTLEYSAATASGKPAETVPVRSPINGRILKVHHECEGAVRTGEPLLEVGDPGALEVEVDVLSADAVRIEAGMKVLFDRWGGDEPLQGIVRNIEPVGFTKISALGVEEQRVLVISDFTSPAAQWQRLGDGYRVEARFVIWQDEDVLQLPASSLFRYQDGWAVFVIEGNHARRRQIEIGQRNGLAAQILAGVEPGESIIIHPSDAVEDGRRVKIR
ncbi:MAG: efflux RND transporter periplasmic adaptor subunit [Gammaproteobacteria bacterium]|nr:efflux RND transporter periplasmic adaptor subunit [Gammaproteobacteria bacterium]MDH3448257.1 efflux RND transporter periplasmic adaptor subunit [Gammaproteobacteria bacterium]